MHTLDDLLAAGVAGRTVLVRSDLNVPLDGDVITDDGRIKASLPTLQALILGGAKVVVTAHLGRPKGAPESKYSLAPAAARLGELLGVTVPLATDLVGPSAAETVAALEPGGIAMLENVRFDARETSKDAGERGRAGRRPGRLSSVTAPPSCPTASAWCTASRPRSTRSPRSCRISPATWCPRRPRC